MKKLKLWMAAGLTAGLLISCAQNTDSMNEAPPAPPTSTYDGASGGADYEKRSEEGYASMDNAVVATDSISSLMSSSAAVISPNMDTSHKFIRTADVRFRVKEVRSATFAIEKIAAQFGGYVAHTGLESTINYVKETPVSDDSTLVTTYYTVSNNMTLRIPATNLDSSLRAMGPLVTYLDYRRIHVEDATLMILRERLAARRIAASSRRLEDAADNTDAKLRDRAAVEDAIFNKQTMADESLLRDMELQDQIRLSTVTLQIYQRQAWTREMIANEKNIDAYKPGFFHDVGQAIAKGWNALKNLVVAILHAWPLIAFVIIVVVIWRIVRRRNQK